MEIIYLRKLILSKEEKKRRKRERGSVGHQIANQSSRIEIPKVTDYLPTRYI